MPGDVSWRIYGSHTLAHVSTRMMSPGTNCERILLSVRLIDVRDVAPDADRAGAPETSPPLSLPVVCRAPDRRRHRLDVFLTARTLDDHDQDLCSSLDVDPRRAFVSSRWLHTSFSESSLECHLTACRKVGRRRPRHRTVALAGHPCRRSLVRTGS